MTHEVLVYPNITFARNLEADSYVCDLRALLPRLHQHRPDLKFTLLLPGPVESLNFPNVRAQMVWPLPTYPNAMRTHFDTARFLAITDWKNRSWDIIWSHLPEATLALKNAMWNSTDERPPIVGYSHWVEIPELNNYAVDMFPAWLAGAMEMEQLGVTTGAMKATILKNAEARGYGGLIPTLDRIIQPMYLGVDTPPDIRVDPEPGLMVWNHRANTYTGWPSVLKALDALWERRQDFRVMVTLEDGPVASRPYGVPSGLPPAGTPGYREAYFTILHRAWVGLPRLVSHWTWPVAVADGMGAGMPYVVPFDYYSGEILPSEYPWFYNGSGQDAGPELVDALSSALDADPADRDIAVRMSLQAARDTTWDRRVMAFVDMFDRTVAGIPRMGDRSKKYAEVYDLARRGGTKRQIKDAMGWGIGIPWGPYRARLRDDGIVMDGSMYHG